jgi:vanillate O-demethylase monooxygenase subunit
VNVFVQTAADIVEDRCQLSILRDAHDIPWGPFCDFMFGADGSTAYDSHQVSDYYGPGAVITGGPFTQRAQISPTGHARELGSFWFLHFITPETPTSTHYFGGVSRNFRLGDEAYTAAQLANYEAVRQQDIVALSAIELYVDRYASTRKELSAKQDAGAIRVRRLLAEQIKRESSTENESH